MRRQRLGDQPRIEGFYNEFVYFRFAGGLSAYEMHRKLRGPWRSSKCTGSETRGIELVGGVGSY